MMEIQLCTVPHNDTLVATETMVVPKYYNALRNVCHLVTLGYYSILGWRVCDGGGVNTPMALLLLC